MEEFNATEGDEAGNCGTNNNQEDGTYTLLGPDRKHYIGRDRLKGSRIWINVPGSEEMFIVFVLNDQNDEYDFYKCINCMRYEKCRKYCSKIKVTKLENGGIKIWESCDHYESCGMPLARIEEIQAKYHRAPGTPRIAKRSSGQGSSSRDRSRTDAVIHRETKQPQPRQMVNRSRTAALQPTRAQPARAVTKKRRTYEDQDDEDDEEVPIVEQLPLPPRAKRSRLSNSTPMNAAPEPSSETRNSSFNAAASISVDEPQEEQLHHFRLHELLESLSDQASASNNNVSVASTSLEVRTPKRFHFATKLPSTPMLRHPNAVGTLRGCEPRILKDDENILHCLPSTDELRKMCQILKLGYAPENQLFWHSTYAANQIHAHSKAETCQEISSERNIGFEALSLFLTNKEESSLSIQTSLKSYIGRQLVNEVGYAAVLNDLIDFNLSRLHLWALSEILKIRIILFSDRGVEIFGDCFNASVPSMLLQLKNNVFLPVVTIA